MNLSFIFFLLTAVSFVVIGLGQIITPIWVRWEKFTNLDPWVHRLVGLYALILGLISLFLLFR